MTDREIIKGLIERDNRITQQFFYVSCRPLLTAILHNVFNNMVEYDEMVSGLYDYLMEDDCFKLRQFQFRSSLYQWMKVVATRFFIRQRNCMVEITSKDSQFEYGGDEEVLDEERIIADRMDVSELLNLMENRRYADAIRNLVLYDIAPETYAKKIGVTVDNLYNIKKRAMAALTRVALKYYGYGR